MPRCVEQGCLRGTEEPCIGQDLSCAGNPQTGQVLSESAAE